MLKRERRSHTVTRRHLIHTCTHGDDDEPQTQHRLISKAPWVFSADFLVLRRITEKQRRISRMARTSHVSVLRSTQDTGYPTLG